MAFLLGWFVGMACGALGVLVLNDVTDNRMRLIEDAMTERAMALAEKRTRRLDYARRGGKLWTWV